MSVLVVVLALATVAAGVLWILRRSEAWADDEVNWQLDLEQNSRDIRAMTDCPLRASDEWYMARAWRDHPWSQQ